MEHLARQGVADYANQLIDCINIIKMMLPREVFVAHGPIIVSQGTEDAALIRSLYDLHGWLYELEKEGTPGDFLTETSMEVIRCIRDHGLNRFQH